MKLKLVDKSLPKNFRKHWDNFSAKAYRAYLDAKEAWRLNKMKNQN